MKKLLAALMLFVILLSLSACGGMSTADKIYNEISHYVLKNTDMFTIDEDVVFFDYKETGLSVGGVYYGYYYTVDNEILLPDFYCGNDIEKIQNDKHNADGGTYFGKPNNGTDWCYIKAITDRWYYYELHWS